MDYERYKNLSGPDQLRVDRAETWLRRKNEHRLHADAIIITAAGIIEAWVLWSIFVLFVRFMDQPSILAFIAVSVATFALTTIGGTAIAFTHANDMIHSLSELEEAIP